MLVAAAAAAAGPELKTDEQKTLYALGLAVSRSLAPFTLTDSEIELVKAGLADGVLTQGQEASTCRRTARRSRSCRRRGRASRRPREKKAGQAFLDKAAAEKGATKTASGLIITTIKPGTGPSPKATDKVKVHYTGTLTDGTVFDSSVQRDEPATFPLNGVIPCWTEGVQLMKVGGKSQARLPVRHRLRRPRAPPKIKPGSTLVFEVELLEIVK